MCMLFAEVGTVSSGRSGTQLVPPCRGRDVGKVRDRSRAQNASGASRVCACECGIPCMRHPVNTESCAQSILRMPHPVHTPFCACGILCMWHPVHMASCACSILCMHAGVQDGRGGCRPVVQSCQAASSPPCCVWDLL